MTNAEIAFYVWLGILGAVLAVVAMVRDYD